jgi:prefoldin subunit 5
MSISDNRSLVDNRPASKLELLILEEQILQLQLGEIPALDDLEDRVGVLENQVISISGELAQEILDRQSSDQTLQSNIDDVSSTLAQEVLDRENADIAIQDLISTTAGDLGTEINDRIAADEVLQGQIDDVSSALAQEVLDRENADIALDSKINGLETFGYDAVVYVSKNGVDTNSGKQHSPFLTITAALNSITDASPTKRYVILVQSGAYTEASVSLKANVFIVGEGQKEAVRITGAVSMHSSFSGSADHRSGFSQVSILSACDFNWQTVTSGAGKLYFNEVSFSSTINMYGHNNATAQALFNSCNIFGNLTISGINVGVFTNNVCFANVTLNQHPNGGMATVLTASGGHCNGTVTQNATTNDFGRRSASFLRHFPSEQLVLNGPSVYADVDLISQGKQTPTISNGANLIALTPRVNHDLTTKNLTTDNITSAQIKPNATNTHNMGDWGRQWFWNFGYVHASSGTDLFLISYGNAFGADAVGRSIGIYTDGGGLQENVNGGEIILQTSTPSGTGVRGKIILNGREIDVTNTQIKNLAAGTDITDAVNKGQLDAISLGLEGDLAQEILDREAADVILQDQIDDLDALTASMQSDIDDLDALTASIVEDVDGLESGLSQEVLDRQAADVVLQDQIDVEKGRIDAILDASDADKDSFAEIVALINSVDTENDEAFAGYVLANDERVGTVESNLAQEILDREEGDTNTLAAANQYTDDAIAAIPPVDLSGLEGDLAQEILDRQAADEVLQDQIDDLDALTAAMQSDIDDLDALTASIVEDVDTLESGLAQEILDRETGDTNTLAAANQYTDDAIAAIPPVDLSGLEGDLAQEILDRQAADEVLQDQIDDLDALTASIQSDLDDVEALANANSGSIDDLTDRVEDLEALPVYEFHTMSVLIASVTEQTYVDCDHLAVAASLNVHIDGMKAHVIRDFTVSEVGGKTRIIWANTFAIGGIEEVEIGETAYISYNYEV